MFGILGLFVGLFAVALSIAVFIFWILMLIDAIKNPALDGTQRVIWVLVIFFLHALGALIYYLVARSKR